MHLGRGQRLSDLLRDCPHLLHRLNLHRASRANSVHWWNVAGPIALRTQNGLWMSRCAAIFQSGNDILVLHVLLPFFIWNL
jgi:hypothetical protein